MAYSDSYGAGMLTFETTIDIEAGAAAVWSILCDAQRYPAWDSGIVGVEGPVALGSRIKITSEVSAARAFPAKVTTLDAPRRMVWTGGMPLGLFKGVRWFTIDDTPTGSRFAMREDFSGPLLKLIGRTLPDLQPSFDQFANGLKAEVERTQKETGQ